MIDNFTTWVDHHGFFVILICFIFATVMSSAPKDTPAYWGFWRTWAFNAFQAIGANAGSYAQTSPLFKKVQTSETLVDASGNKTQTDTSISKSTQPAASTTTSVPPPPVPAKVQGVFP